LLACVQHPLACVGQDRCRSAVRAIDNAALGVLALEALVGCLSRSRAVACNTEALVLEADGIDSLLDSLGGMDRRARRALRTRKLLEDEVKLRGEILPRLVT
jgi:hypothetical protein